MHRTNSSTKADIIELKKKLIKVLPSSDIKKWYEIHSPDWDISQMATLASLYMKRRHLASFLGGLAQASALECEKAYLRSAGHDVSRRTYKRRGLSKRTQRLYDKYRDHVGKLVGVACFDEYCNLPVLVKRGDVVSYRTKGVKRYAVVFALPHCSNEDPDSSNDWVFAYGLEDLGNLSIPLEIPDVVLLPTDMDFVKDEDVPIRFVNDLENYRTMCQDLDSFTRSELREILSGRDGSLDNYAALRKKVLPVGVEWEEGSLLIAKRPDYFGNKIDYLGIDYSVFMCEDKPNSSLFIPPGSRVLVKKVLGDYEYVVDISNSRGTVKGLRKSVLDEDDYGYVGSVDDSKKEFV